MAISTIGSNGLTTPLPASNLGTPSAINLSNATALARAALPTGSVLQVVNGTTTGQTSTTGSTYITTGLTASITPSSSSNKVLAIVTTSCRFTSSCWMGLQLWRGGSSIASLAAGLGFSIAGSTQTQQFTANYLDSPATTSSTTYTLYFSNQNSPTGTVTVQQDSQVATITLIEISA